MGTEPGSLVPPLRSQPLPERWRLAESRVPPPDHPGKTWRRERAQEREREQAPALRGAGCALRPAAAGASRRARRRRTGRAGANPSCPPPTLRQGGVRARSGHASAVPPAGHVLPRTSAPLLGAPVGLLGLLVLSPGPGPRESCARQSAPQPLTPAPAPSGVPAAASPVRLGAEGVGVPRAQLLGHLRPEDSPPAPHAAGGQDPLASRRRAPCRPPRQGSFEGRAAGPQLPPDMNQTAGASNNVRCPPGKGHKVRDRDGGARAGRGARVEAARAS